ncbi:two-component sensor histidine kinase [Nocardia cyriacigeorgica]|uniref:histidine kinase n=1 Tax=Nocardia cyriacigeorgica TaxID=135487 RepID=A0ABX0CJK1_9NOCA|nr:ATP-binding protein [Nocardia cyriacigeorgica]NEW56334.1 two-component sensor histidine kinase [Nocardia cyriacigeorgica]
MIIMNLRHLLAAAGILVPLVGAVLVPAPVIDVIAPVMACVTFGLVLATWPRSRGLVPLAAIATGSCSLVVTIVSLPAGRPAGEPMPEQALWILLEPPALMVFAYLPVRWSSPRAALGACVPALAIALSVQRYMPQGETAWAMIAGSLLWLLPGLAAGGVGLYQRHREDERRRAIADARREQRLDLASDLHDFVAHDVSEIVARAQAARMVLTAGDPRLDEAFTRIEQAGLRALASMDRTIHILRDPGEAAREPVGGIADLPAVAERFGDGRVEVRLDLGEVAGVPREPAAVAYRVVIEALTNIRRHAPTASEVDIRVGVRGGGLHLTVADDGDGAPGRAHRNHSGLGLPGLTERVESLRGTLTAGPRHPRGWTVDAHIPLEGKHP